MLHVMPAPSGGAAKVVFGVPPGVAPRLYASSSATLDPDHARLLYQPGDVAHEVDAPTIARERPAQQWRALLDTDRSLRTGVVYYHLVDPSGQHDTVVASVDARDPLVSALIADTRTFITERLEYHLHRYLTEGRVHVPTGEVPIYEQESLSRDNPLPCILYRESIMPAPQVEAIGKHAGTVTIAGERFLERAHRYRARVDLLIITESPKLRNILAQLVHEALLSDYELLEEAGWREVLVQRTMRSAEAPDGYRQYGEEITLDGVIEMRSRTRLTVTVPEPRFQVHGRATR